MLISFDPAKETKNVEERGLSFALVSDLDWDTALIKPDVRRDYGEIRLRVLALLEGRLHTAIVTPRAPGLRVISFRKANRREMKEYASYQ